MRKWKKHLRSWRRPVIKAAFLYRRESPCTTSYLNCARRNWKLRLHNIQQRQNRHLRCDFLRKGKVTLNSSRPNNLLSFSHSVDVPFFFAIASSASSQVYGWWQHLHCKDIWHELVLLVFFFHGCEVWAPAEVLSRWLVYPSVAAKQHRCHFIHLSPVPFATFTV